MIFFYFSLLLLIILQADCQIYIQPDFLLVNGTIQTNNILNNREIGSCQCDLTYKSCDFKCCCDTECSVSIIDSWKNSDICLEENKYLNLKYPECSSFENIIFNSKNIDLRQENTLTCLAYQNVPYLGNFYNEIKGSINYDNLLSIIKTKNQFFDQFVLLKEYSTTESFYSPGDYIRTTNSLNIQYYQNILSIPGTDLYGNCNDNSLIKYFEDLSPTTCIRTFFLESECNNFGTVSAYRYLKSIKIGADPQLKSSLSINIKSAFILDIQTGILTPTTITSDTNIIPEKLLFSDQDCRCKNTLKEAHFTVKINNGSISQIDADIILYNEIKTNLCSDLAKYKQTFSWKYYTNSVDIYYPKSGNPGYIYSKPLLLGYMSSGFDNGKAIYRPKKGIPLNYSNYDGKCSPINEKTNRITTINFGENIDVSCYINMNLDELKSFCNSNSLKNYEIYNNFNSEFNIYVGIFGNSNHIYIKDWIPLNVSSTQINVTFDIPSSTCNIPTTTLLTFYYSETGSEINPQKYIVYAEKSFSKTTYMKFTKTNTNDAQNFNLFIKTQFIKIKKSMITPEPKIVPTNFDKWLAQIFRPFLVTGGSNAFSSKLNYFICLIILTIILL